MASASETAIATTSKKKVSTPPHIPDDVTFCILSKLPLKSLTRFTSVQKSWSLLFQNPHFMNMFRINFFISKHNHDDDDDTFVILRERILRDLSLNIYDRDLLYILSGDRLENRERLNLPPSFEDDNRNWHFGFQILGPVNGFLCLYDDFSGTERIVVLWNPHTGECNTVPPSLHDGYEFYHRPQVFGYDCVRDDCKVMRTAQYGMDFDGNWIYLPDTDDSFWKKTVHELDLYDDDYWEEEGLIVEAYDPFCEIYSLLTNSWRKLDEIDTSVYFPCRSCVSLNELSHWLNEENLMVSFDFSNEIFYATNLPFDFDVGIEDVESDLVVLNGVVSLISDYDKPYFNIWILGELGVKESWTKLFVVGPLFCVMHPIGVGKKNHIFFRKENEDLALFDCSTQTIAEIGAKKGLACCQIVLYKPMWRRVEEVGAVVAD